MLLQLQLQLLRDWVTQISLPPPSVYCKPNQDSVYYKPNQAPSAETAEPLLVDHVVSTVSLHCLNDQQEPFPSSDPLANYVWHSF